MGIFNRFSPKNYNVCRAQFSGNAKPMTGRNGSVCARTMHNERECVCVRERERERESEKKSKERARNS
jgi:hypothetical protein